MNRNWNIAGFSLNPAEKLFTMLKVAGTAEQIPATLINGKNDGKTLIVMSGLHGGEYTGIEAAIETGRELDPKKLNGQIILLHPISLGIFLSGSSSINIKDNKNLNRIFPPNPNGTESERIAAFLYRELLSKADFCLDLHSGGHCTKLFTHGYITGVCDESVYNAAAKAAMVLDIPYFLRSADKTGAYNYAGMHGIPGITIERGCLGKWERQDVDLFKKDIRNLMRHLAILDDELEENEYSPQITQNRVYVRAEAGGCWYPESNVIPGNVIEKGEKLGEIRDYFGNLIEEKYAEDSGVILFVSSSLSVRNSNLVFYAKFERYQ